MLNQSVNFLAKLSDQLKKDNRLEKITENLINKYRLEPHFGIEIEFYLSHNIDVIEFEKEIGHDLKRERGNNQFEIILSPSCDLTNYANKILNLKSEIYHVAALLGGEAILKAKPFQDDYGSSIHFNLSLNQDPSILEFASKSLCHFMLDTFLIFMPEADDYLRLDSRFMAPTHVSYGGNNRTTAIRIPSSLPLRLEHRIASPSADPYLAMAAILNSILLALNNPAMIKDYLKTFGNAYDEQYQYTPLPPSREEALRLFKADFFDSYNFMQQS